MSGKSHSSKIELPSKEILEEVGLRPHSDAELELTPELEDKIEKLMQFFDKSGINYDKFNRKAYPNNDPYMNIPGQHDTKKWLEAVKTVYYKERDGLGRIPAIRQATQGWNIMETYDFLNWLKFYESGDHMKYKFAQLWYENDAPGYFLHIKPDPVKEPEPKVSGNDIDMARDSAANELSSAEKKSIIEKQRSKIVGRLDSAEKLMRSHEGQIFAGKEFEALLDAIYQLKKRVQMVNKVSTSTRLYEDMIVRQANILVRDGFTKAASVLYKVAQANNPPPAGTGTKNDTPLTPNSPAPPGQGSGSAGGLPSVGPGMAQNPPESAPNNAIDDFLDNLETGKVTTKENAQAEDSLEVEDYIDVSDSDDELLVTEAQAVPMDEPITDSPAPSPLNPSPVKGPKPLAPDVKAPEAPATEEPLEVTEDDLKPKGDVPAPAAINFDAKIDAVFANITVADVVAKLEDLAKIYKTREVPRQLGIVDMMLDSLGLASYFPSLSEATNKALESNNYISTRLEDILSKLRGAMTTKEIDLKGGDAVENPEVSGIKNKLKSDDDKEKARKQMRKDQEASELAGKGKENPEVEIEEDLGAPPAPAAPPPAAPKPA